MDRRVFIQGLVATGTGLAAAPAAAQAQAMPAISPSHPVLHENLWPLLAPLAPGNEIGLGWRVESLSAVSLGAAVLTLGSGTRRVRVHLCRLDGAARGVAHSDRVDLVLMNRANGKQVTEESLARALTALSLLIRGNERAGVTVPESMMSHGARLTAFGAKPLT